MIGAGYVINQWDPDAGAFINATGIGGIQAVAINNLVNELKSAGLWGLMMAIYPMVGGTAFAHKFNLVNPQDTDAAFRLNFVGGWTHSASGAKPDGVAGTYADTFFNPTTHLSTTNGHISNYSFTNSAPADDVEIGAGVSGGAETLIAHRFSDGNGYVFWASGGGGFGSDRSNGFFINNRQAVTDGWYNASRVINIGSGTNNPNRTFYLAAQNNGTGTYRNSSRGTCFASIGRSLATDSSTTNPVNFTNIVNNFQRTLQRNTF